MCEDNHPHPTPVPALPSLINLIDIELRILLKALNS